MRRIGLAAGAAGIAMGLALAPGEAGAVRVPAGEVATGLGGGAFNQDLGRITDAGVAWQFRTGVNVLPFLGAEVFYQGLGTDADPIGAARGTGLTFATNQVFSLDAKLMAPVQIGRSGLFAGYVFGGAGYSFIGFSSTGFFNIENDNAFAVPLGGGLEYAVGGGLLIDARFTYNLLTGSRATFARSGDSWNVAANVGAVFGSTR